MSGGTQKECPNEVVEIVEVVEVVEVVGVKIVQCRVTAGVKRRRH